MLSNGASAVCPLFVCSPFRHGSLTLRVACDNEKKKRYKRKSKRKKKKKIVIIAREENHEKRASRNYYRRRRIRRRIRTNNVSTSTVRSLFTSDAYTSASSKLFTRLIENNSSFFRVRSYRVRLRVRERAESQTLGTKKKLGDDCWLRWAWKKTTRFFVVTTSWIHEDFFHILYSYKKMCHVYANPMIGYACSRTHTNTRGYLCNSFIYIFFFKSLLTLTIASYSVRSSRKLETTISIETCISWLLFFHLWSSWLDTDFFTSAFM